jgi:hypothetical protein
MQAREMVDVLAAAGPAATTPGPGPGAHRARSRAVALALGVDLHYRKIGEFVIPVALIRD